MSNHKCCLWCHYFKGGECLKNELVYGIEIEQEQNPHAETQCNCIEEGWYQVKFNPPNPNEFYCSYFV